MPTTMNKLSESTNGRPIPVVQTGGPSGTKIHEATATSGELDLVTLYAWNQSSGDEDLVIEYGGTGAGNEMTVTIKSNEPPVCVVPRLPLLAGLEVRAYNDGGTASVILIAGTVLRTS